LGEQVNTANRLYPIYDRKVASVFGFRVPDNHGTFDLRLEKYMIFYAKVRDIYSEILNGKAASNLPPDLCGTF
jgi:hypothetical protein